MSIRDAKFRQGSTAGHKIQARPGFLRSPVYGCWAHAGLEGCDHQGCGVGVGVARSRGNEPGVGFGVGVDQIASTPTPERFV